MEFATFDGMLAINLATHPDRTVLAPLALRLIELGNAEDLAAQGARIAGPAWGNGRASILNRAVFHSPRLFANVSSIT